MLNKLKNKTVEFFKALKNALIFFRIKKHNRKLFTAGIKNSSSKPIVLMELNGMHSAHIAYAYLADELAKKHCAKIKAYAPNSLIDWKSKIIFFANSVFGFKEFGVYRSFGVNDFIGITLNKNQRKHAKELLLGIYKSGINEKRDIEDLEIGGVWLGDLIYDSYLRKYQKPTIDLESDDFRLFILEMVELFVFWDDYFKHNDVRAINVSHCVYWLAIPLRIAVNYGIDAFQVNATHFYRLDKSNLFAYNDFFKYREIFSTLLPEVQVAGIKAAKDRIRRRFNGEVGVDMAYSKKTAYGASLNKRLIEKSPKTKIIVAAHCFFDSPHSYGKNLFPDFYEWLECLGRISQQTDYDWYIKTHPDFIEGTKKIVEEFTNKYQKFKLLPSESSHLQIISEGINLALTCYGTIGFEYAALGIPVINASMNNPHVGYNFNIHIGDVDQYIRILSNLENLHLKIDENEVFEYYFMHNIYNTENILFDNYSNTISLLGGYKNQFSTEVYVHWLREWSSVKNSEIVSAIHKFVISNKFRMDYSFYGRNYLLQIAEMV